MLRPDTLALTALLALLTALGPISTDMYLPSLPAIGRLLNASVAEVQLTLSAYLVGFAISQIFYGPAADRYGRKPVLLLAVSLYCTASLACSIAPNIHAVIVLRVLQAMGAAGAIVIARAVVRDLYAGARAGRELSLMGAIMALAPVIAPLIGSVVQTLLGWRANFLIAGSVGALVVLLIWHLLPETLRERVTDRMSVRSVLQDYRLIVRNRGFLAYLGIVACSYSGLFAWISGSSFVLQNLYELSPFQFGLTFALCGIGFLTGTSLAARLVTRRGLDRTIGWGTLALAAGGVSMLVSLAADWPPVPSLVASMMLYLTGLGLAMPQSMAGALTPFPRHAGAASSLIGFFQQTAAAGVGLFVGQLVDRSPWPLAVTIAFLGCLALVFWVISRGVRGREVHPLHP